MSNVPSDEALIDAATRAGWLLEMEAARILEAAGYATIQGWAHRDPDDDAKSRELDALGWRAFLDHDEVGITVGVRVLLECKQSASPFAFVGRSRGARGWPEPEEHVWPFEHVELPIAGRERATTLVDAWSTLGFDDIPSAPALDERRAVQMTKLNRKGSQWHADNDGIFDGLVMPLAKALRASHKRLGQVGVAAKPGTNVLATRSRIAVLHFPVVLTSAPLLFIDATHDAPTVTVERWCSVERQLETAKTRGRFLIDVVNHEHLEAYLSERVGAFATEVAARVRADPTIATHARVGMKYDPKNRTVIRSAGA